MTDQPLNGKTAIVTGASRGVGKGIALELGAAGATVYVTGRTAKPGGGPLVLGQTLPGSVGETAAEIDELGGSGVAVALDHRDDEAVRALFAQVKQEQGRLDVLVNNAYYVPDSLLTGAPFWEMPIDLWDGMTDIGVRSTYVASVFGAGIMVKQGSGLIVNTSSPGGGRYSMTPAYGVGKVAVDRMAFDMAHELREHNVATVSLWLGLIATERTHVAAKQFEQFDISVAESPRFLGRGVVALATDPKIMEFSGQVLYTADLPKRYGFTDVDGSVPPSFSESWGEPPRFSDVPPR